MDTSDSFAFVKFVSDSSGNAAGFSLSFEASVEGTASWSPEPRVEALALASFSVSSLSFCAACGGELNAPSGTISSPNYPNLYPHSRVCRWELKVQAGRRLMLTIHDLRLEGSGTSCVFDYVDVSWNHWRQRCFSWSETFRGSDSDIVLLRTSEWCQ